MSRILSLLFLSFTFCCSPATRPNPPPQTSPQAEVSYDETQPPPQGEQPRYAQPPAGEPKADLRGEERGWKEAPREGSSEKKAAPAAQAGAEAVPAPSYGGDKYDANKSADTSSSPKAERGSGVGAMRQPPRPQEEERPGLGTTWGETRYSHVDEVQFVRAASAPTFNATLWYNDQRGASAMAQSEGRNLAYNRAAALALGGAVTMTLRNEYGSPLSAVYANGRTSAIGEAGQRYIISLQNNSADRFEVVLSVDGLDVLDGREAAYGKRGYLLEPHGTIDIEGFRQSDDHVAAFRFGSVRDSYAARTGGGRNVGVIGCAVFAERGYYSYREIERRRGADPFPGKWATPPIHIVH